MQLLLPSERIVELSSEDTLHCYSKALYRTLSYPPLECLETLATNSEKAGFVRFLKVGSESVIDDHLRAMDYLLKALVNMHMHSLSDFRLPDERQLPKKIANSLNKILWSVYELGILPLKTNCRCLEYTAAVHS